MMTKGSLKFKTENYYELADAQTFIGPSTRVKEFKGIVPLFVASYCETGDEYLDDYGLQGTESMKILNDYFGELPFQHYSIMLRKGIPLEPGNAPALAMEHLQSSTFFGDTSGKRKSKMSPEAVIRTMPTYLHHMSHAFIPLRCYGDTYRPFVMEIPPIINNIWFNEGFMWFLAYDTLKLEVMKTNFYNSVYNTSALIKKMSLEQLSQTASTLYGLDFRIGRSVFSRGALMAIEMNNYLKERSEGKKSIKDVLRYLYNWSKQSKRPFTMEEFPILIYEACSIDLSGIYKKWQLPVE
jgi:predicted metalloprotease with PDZ domain